MMRKLVFAWGAKDQAHRAIPPVWRERAEQIARAAMATGALDFRRIERSGLPKILTLAGLWPTGMPLSLELSALGLTAEDLDGQDRAERKAKDAELKRRRTVSIGAAF
jgi:hypothetical protein